MGLLDLGRNPTLLQYSTELKSRNSRVGINTRLLRRFAQQGLQASGGRLKSLILSHTGFSRFSELVPLFRMVGREGEPGFLSLMNDVPTFGPVSYIDSVWESHSRALISISKSSPPLLQPGTILLLKEGQMQVQSLNSAIIKLLKGGKSGVTSENLNLLKIFETGPALYEALGGKDMEFSRYSVGDYRNRLGDRKGKRTRNIH